jgi:hypothetical protein
MNRISNEDTSRAMQRIHNKTTDLFVFPIKMEVFLLLDQPTKLRGVRETQSLGYYHDKNGINYEGKINERLKIEMDNLETSLGKIPSQTCTK